MQAQEERQQQSRRAIKASQRKKQILDALIVCAGRYGLEATTVAQVADEAKLQRTLVYHYFPDRNSLTDSLIDHIIEMNQERWRHILDELDDPRERVDTLLKHYFGGGQFEFFPAEGVAFAELTLIGSRDRSVKARLRTMWEGFLDRLEQELTQMHPGARKSEYEMVAYALTCLFEYNYHMLVQGLGQERHGQAMRAARILIDQLAK